MTWQIATISNLKMRGPLFIQVPVEERGGSIVGSLVDGICVRLVGYHLTVILIL